MSTPDLTPDVDEIRWRLEPDALAAILFRPEIWPTVNAWCQELQRAYDARLLRLTEEERTRAENITPGAKLRQAVEQEFIRRRRKWRRA
jgi:hypothetical protein